MFEKTYDAAEIEPRITAEWEKADAFRAGAGAEPGAEPYSIVIPPPNVTGSLHMGHALNNTLQDVLVRYHRMRGRDVLWQPGVDHAGIATQMVVERQLAEEGNLDRRALGREAFIERVWRWKEQSGGMILEQLRRLGASCDWSRERFTMDEGLSRAVIEVFVRLYKERLIYRDKRLVNWDPRFQTAISDLEVEQVEVKGKLWHFRYPLADEPSRWITVATTRPETMLGDTAVAVHPDDPRYRELVGESVRLPLVGRLIPIVADDYADPETGSGAVKITPAHDFNDFEVGRRHRLKMVSVMDAEGRMALAGNADFLEGADESGLAPVLALNGADRFAAREKVVAMMEEQGLVDEVEDHVHTVPHGDRSGVPIEPFLTDQWYVNAQRLAEPAIAAVREGRTTFVPKTWEKTYFDWMENIQPWCISRQLWWGHQIPAWYGPGGRIFVEKSERDAIWAAEALYGRAVVVKSREEALAAWDAAGDAATPATANDPAQSQAASETGAAGEGPGEDVGDAAADAPAATDAVATSQVSTTAQPPVVLYRDEDVLDTWFSSALWPFSTLGWPERTPELARYYPTTVLVTAFDIIFFWVARMMMAGLHFLDREPFGTVYIHAIVRDEKGAKMSKSKGNVIDPLDLINEFGADALRFTLAAMAAQGRDIKLAPARVQGYRNFATKLWNAARFADLNECRRVAEFDPSAVRGTLSKWIIAELSRTVAAVTEGIETYRFNEAAGALYRFTWNTFCDWYVELAKPVLIGGDPAEREEVRATTAFVIDEIVKLLHPFMPFLTEELWRVTGEAGGPPRTSLLIHARWPRPGPADAEAAAEINWLIELIAGIRSVRAETSVPAAAQIPLVMVGAGDKARGWLGVHGEAVKRLARVSEIGFADEPPPESAQIVVGEAIVSLPLAGVVDLAAERARLGKEIEKVDADIARIEAKLANPKFVERAPEEVVEEQRERREEAAGRRAKLADALTRLKGAA